MERNTLEYFLEYFKGANMTFRGSLVLAEIIEVMFFAGTVLYTPNVCLHLHWT